MVGSSGTESTGHYVLKNQKLRTLVDDSLGWCPATEKQGEAQNQEPGCRLGLEKKSEWEVGSQGDNLQHPVEGLALQHLIPQNMVDLIAVSIKSSWGCS